MNKTKTSAVFNARYHKQLKMWYAATALFEIHLKLFAVMKLLLVPLLALMILTNVAYSHQQKAAITRIEFNPNTNKLEIMHRFELHDAEHAVSELFDKHADIISSAETQEQFARYVIERFGIYKTDNQALSLTYVGHEIEGKHFWVYQETNKPEKIQGLQVVHNALRDIWFSQTNTVNVKLDQSMSTLTFTDNTEVLNIDFVQ